MGDEGREEGRRERRERSVCDYNSEGKVKDFFPPPLSFVPK